MNLKIFLLFEFLLVVGIYGKKDDEKKTGPIIGIDLGTTYSW